MDEAVFVTDLQARYPPVLHVWVIAIAHVDRTPAAHLAFVAVVEVLEAMQIVQVPEDRCVFAINFEGVERFVAARVAG